MKRVLSCLILCCAVPAVVIGGALLLPGKRYVWISLCVAVLSCVPFFLRFERREANVGRTVLIAVMTALTVLSRIVFAAIPGFKPVTALVVITAMYFGGEAGFLTGSLAALISNIYFGQGPWTPFQMFAWGIVGFLAGLLARPLKRHLGALLVYGAFSGVLFSFLMDIWTVLSIDGYFNPTRYAAALASAAPYTVLYAVSNVLFLLVFSKPLGAIFKRIKRKYGL